MIACLSGASLRFPIRAPLAEALRSTVQVCRNDECYAGTWPSTDEPGGDTGTGFRLPDFGDHPERIDELMSPHVDVILWNMNGGPRLDVAWTPWSPSDLKNGDLYHVTMTTEGGRQLIDYGRVVDPYPDSSIGSGECRQACKYASIDVDASDECRVCVDGGGP